ncbi:MAG TPA: AAA family ATPase [Candidatus Nitrosopelagicus sp.]|jgi:dephospho-CoA kinase|nr:AAA family ATPase [Candidatus Nitrosopelagicus sp.]
MPKLVVCLTGMPGAGKSTIVSKLKEENYETFSLGDGVRAEAKRQNLEPTGENLGKLMLELRQKNGPGAIAELIKESIQKSNHEIIIIDGIRSIHEINVLKETGNLKLLAVEASSETRFNFLTQRKRSDDPLTKEKFEERDNREISVGLQEIIKLADETIENNNVTIDELVNSAIEIFQNWIK